MKTEYGHYYHCYNRGNNGQTIFFEKENYLYLIKSIKKRSSRFHITVIAYCLMPNHYHLLLRQDGTTQISRFIQSTFQSYAQSFNNQYHRTGRLFDNPNPPKHVADETYLFQVCRYIHRNPLEAGIVKTLESWPYSNYPEFIGIRNGRLYPRDLVREWFASPEEYRRFVEVDFDSEKYRSIRRYLFEEL